MLPLPRNTAPKKHIWRYLLSRRGRSVGCFSTYLPICPFLIITQWTPTTYSDHLLRPPTPTTYSDLTYSDHLLRPHLLRPPTPTTYSDHLQRPPTATSPTPTTYSDLTYSDLTYSDHLQRPPTPTTYSDPTYSDPTYFASVNTYGGICYLAEPGRSDVCVSIYRYVRIVL